MRCPQGWTYTSYPKGNPNNLLGQRVSVSGKKAIKQSVVPDAIEKLGQSNRQVWMACMCELTVSTPMRQQPWQFGSSTAQRHPRRRIHRVSSKLASKATAAAPAAAAVAVTKACNCRQYHKDGGVCLVDKRRCSGRRIGSR